MISVKQEEKNEKKRGKKENVKKEEKWKMKTEEENWWEKKWSRHGEKKREKKSQPRKKWAWAKKENRKENKKKGKLVLTFLLGLQAQMLKLTSPIAIYTHHRPNLNWALTNCQAQLKWAPATSKADHIIAESATCTCQTVFVFTDTFPIAELSTCARRAVFIFMDTRLSRPSAPDDKCPFSWTHQ